MENLTHQQVRDPELMAIARKRASFKQHLLSYLAVNSFLWLLWAFSDDKGAARHGFPWPIYPLLGWGIGLFSHYISAYVFPKNTLVDREYEKLVQNQNSKF